MTAITTELRIRTNHYLKDVDCKPYGGKNCFFNLRQLGINELPRTCEDCPMIAIAMYKASQEILNGILNIEPLLT